MNQIIGKKVIRIDGYEKVTGKAIFGDDIKLVGMLYAACRYTDIPAGKITKVDISKAEKMEGVEAIALFKDIPGMKKLGPIRQDQFALVNNEVFYSGDVIAVVAATSKEIAFSAVDSIEVKYDTLEGIFDIQEAIKSSSHLVHPEFKSNVVIHYPLRKGDVKKGFAQSEHIIEREYRTNFCEHAYIEPESITAVPDLTSKGFKIYGSIQNPFTTRKIVSSFMGLNLNQVNIFGSTLGGSFGGKDDIVNMMACRVALLSKMTGRPVKLTNSRENSIKESYKRHPYIMKYKVGFNKNGKLIAMKINILADSGAYSSQSFFVTWRSVVQATGPYEIENVETDIRAVYTNNTYTAAMRGFGSPQIIFAQESLMDEIAEICGISPLEIRRINGYKHGSITASGQKLSEHKVSLLQVIDEAVKKSNYKEKIIEYRKQNKIDNRYKYGIGLSCSFRGCSLGAEGTDASSAIVSVQADGSVYILAGCNENGQGLKTTFSQIAAEILGINFDKIVFLEPQTATITDGGPTVASRATLMGGNAVIKAAQKVKDTIFNVIKDEIKVIKIEETEWKNNYIYNKKSKIKIRFEDASEKAYWAGVNLSAYGWSKAPDVSWEKETGQGNAYFTYVYGCQIAEIKVDTHTGKIDILKITAAHDVGKVINKLGAEGQVYGGVAQGIGYGIFEDYNIQNGIVKSENLDEYLIPTIKDIYKIDPILIENLDKYGPFGAKSLGEPTLELTSPAINNALSFATGKRTYQIPLTLEQVFLGKNLVKPTRQSEKPLVKYKKRKITPRISDIRMVTPPNIKDALNLLYKDKYKIISGGTDVLIQLRKNTEFQKLLNIYNLPELKSIEENEDEVRIGSAITFTELIENKSIKKDFPLLINACSLIGSRQIRNRGTIGGNIINASPSADSVPPLIVYKARLLLQSKNSNREINVEDFIIKNYQTQIK
ncbi:MAG: molybdopterin-dependent oxidoreductase, partial [Candidatus Cloacimonetes bacterium]|nr:molybdopterin-dependent oxidoreductase [Candidatus Cloacimonadota bacterium]